MKKEINLLKSKQEKESDSGLIPLVKSLSLVLILVYVLSLIGIYSFGFYVSQKEKEILIEIDQKERQIKKAARLESLQLTVKSRLNALAWVFGKEKKAVGLVEAWRRLGNVAADKVTLASVVIDNFGETVSLRGSAERMIDLIDFFQRVKESSGEKDGFNDLLLTSLTKGNEGYKFNLELKVSS
ncbi:MAG: hypothetical protein JW991_02855 [Candidatus Pacebacteria bacterium]|nr:hypothetical protein [Candidatus Paceibacterota bacterium]